ncbi:MAG: glycosyltransferase family 39 protein [Armatimonadota bacterium]
MLVWTPLVSDYPQTWDEVQYILAVREFDVEKHQPHPPGYYLHVRTAGIAHAVGLNERESLISVSMLAGAVFVGLVVWWVGEVAGSPAAIAAAALTVSSPLVITAATEGRTYMTGALGAAVIGYLSWRMLRGDSRWVIPSAIAVALTAGFRPTTAVFLLPLWVWALVQSGWRPALTGVAAAGLATTIWVMPFLAEVGGLAHFMDLSARLGGPVSESSPLHGGGVAALATNLKRLGSGLALLVGVGIVGVVRGLRSSLTESTWWLLLWILPALAFFLLMHTGTPLYAMVFAAPLLAVVSAGLAEIGRAMVSDKREPVLTLAIVVLIQGSLIYGNVVRERGRADSNFAEIKEALQPLADDRTVALVTTGGEQEAAEGYLPFRHAGYLLPDAHLYYFPLEVPGPVGRLPNSMHKHSTYLVAPPVVHEDVRHLLLLGGGLRKFLPETCALRLVYEAAGFDASLVRVEPNHIVRLDRDGSLRMIREDTRW